ncbi:MAG TPA: NAD(P)-dependent oxidoreductase [Chloroflexota bacterium]|nr:NAD(P)-dependent oxidoreductase [Chloroflexota bacterium]
MPQVRRLPEQVLALTGGAGHISTALRPLLREHYRLRLLDLREPPGPFDADEYLITDVSHLSAVEAALEGASAVVHLAANPRPNATWADVRTANIEATQAVFEAARRQAIRKVVFASTNHVMGFANLEQAWPIDTCSPIRPDSLYGVSKAFGEALARYYADAFDMSILCVRIGWFASRDPDSPNLNPLWISARDLAQIILRCLDTSLRFGIYNATSNNPQAHWDLQNARDELGYAPQDDVSAYPVGSADWPYVDPRAGVPGA